MNEITKNELEELKLKARHAEQMAIKSKLEMNMYFSDALKLLIKQFNDWVISLSEPVLFERGEQTRLIQTIVDYEEGDLLIEDDMGLEYSIDNFAYYELVRILNSVERELNRRTRTT